MYFNQNVRMNGKEGITDLVRGGMILSALHEKDAELFEKGRCVSVKPRHLFNKLTELFWKPQGLFAALSLIIGLYIRWHQPTRIYASGYTYVRISLYVYMSLCQAVPNEYKVERFWCLPHKRMFKGFVFPRNITVDKISLAAKRSRCF